MTSLPPDLAPPVRVHGIAKRTKFGVRLVAHRIEHIDFPTATRIANAAVLTADPKTWSRRYVEVEDDWMIGFEASILGKDFVWLDTSPTTTVTCKPPPSKASSSYTGAKHRVRVVGFAYTATARYGHLGMSPAKIVATSITYLDPKRSECR